MKRGDIMLVRGKGFVSHMIRRITRSEWSHVAWVLSEQDLLESDYEVFGEKGVQIEPVATYANNKKSIIRLSLLEEYVEKAISIASSKIGHRYDASLFLSLFWRWVLSFVFFWKSSTLRNQRHGWICSELVATPLYESCYFRFRDDIPVENIVPEDIWGAVKSGKATLVSET